MGRCGYSGAVYLCPAWSGKSAGLLPLVSDAIGMSGASAGSDQGRSGMSDGRCQAHRVPQCVFFEGQIVRTGRKKERRRRVGLADGGGPRRVLLDSIFPTSIPVGLVHGAVSVADIVGDDLGVDGLGVDVVAVEPLEFHP